MPRCGECGRGRSGRTPRPNRRRAPTPLRAVALGGLVDRLDRVMAAAAGPKPIGLRLEPRLPLRLQRVERPRLARAVKDHGNSERAALRAAARLRDVHAPDRQGLERLGDLLHPVGQFCLACGVSTTSPSTPAVKRPALRSVTRRTLKSVFARERSINFCRLRTLFRSPACDAVKIRCRNRRTLVLHPPPIDGVPAEGRVLWSVHHDRRRGV